MDYRMKPQPKPINRPIFNRNRSAISHPPPGSNPETLKTRSSYARDPNIYMRINGSDYDFVDTSGSTGKRLPPDRARACPRFNSFFKS